MLTELRSRSPRTRLAVLTALYFGVGAFLVLSPDPAVPSRVLAEVQHTLLDFGADRATLRRAGIEYVGNLLLAVPAPVLAARWFTGVPWWAWLPAGAAASAAVELFQLVIAPDSRSASLRDVAANTAGVLLGCLVVAGRQRRAHQQGSARPMISPDGDRQHRGA